MSSNRFPSEMEEKSKLSTRVLRPPGGASSDLFGSEIPVAMPRNNIRNHMASNIFGNNTSVKNNNGTPKSNDDRRNPKTLDSHKRLFGEPEQQFITSKDRMKSNIPFGGKIGNDINGSSIKQPIMNGNGNGNGGNSAVNGNGANTNGGVVGVNGSGGGGGGLIQMTNGHSNKIENGGDHYNNGFSKTDGNPITGEGYNRSTGNGGGEINTTIVPMVNGTNQVINKNRIPPGGYSSGLW